MDGLEHLLRAGQADDEALKLLRGLGESAARSIGLPDADAEAFGVEFAGDIVTTHLSHLRRWPGDPRAYLHRAAHWSAAKYRRRLRRRGEESLDAGRGERAACDVERLALLRTSLAEIEAFVATLPPMEQELYRVCFREETNAPEAAAKLGLEPANVRQRLRRLRLKIRRRFAPPV